MQKQNESVGLQQFEKDQKDNLLSENSLDFDVNKVQGISESKSQTVETIARQQDEIIDPIEEIMKKNQIMPLLAVIDKIDLNRKIQEKPLISILATKFLPLQQILTNKQISFPLDDDRRSPLHYAIEANDVKAAAWLISKNHPNQQDNFGNTPILDAIRLGRRRCFLLCLKNKLYDQRAPIYAAMYNRHWELRVMYGLKIDIFAYRDQQNKSAFERSLEYCSFDCAEFMIKIKPNLKLDKYKSLTESKGLMRKLKNIQRNMSIGYKLKNIVRPLLILILLYFTLNADLLGNSQTQLYQASKPFYFILIFMILGLYGLMYIFGIVSKEKVQYKEKNRLEEILMEPTYKTLEDICPVCTNFTDYIYDHCYSCGCCVQKFHFHSFVCVNKSNEVFWIAAEFTWLYLGWSILQQFISFLAWNSIDNFSVSSYSIIKLLSQVENLLEHKNYLGIGWMTFLVFLFLYQTFYCLSLVGMMAMRRKYQEIIHSEKYSHLYHVIKVDNNFMNKEKRIFVRGFLGGIKRCVRNILVYFFIRD